MADQRLTSKPSASNIDDLDLIHIVDVSDTTSDPTGTSKKLTWSLIKSTLKTFFDAIYQVKGNYVTTDTVQQINADKGYNRSSVQIDSLGDLSLVNRRFVIEKTLGDFVTKTGNQLTGLTGNKKWDGDHEFTKLITSPEVPLLDFDVPNKIYVDNLVSVLTQVSQSNLSFGESYIDNYRDRVLDDVATYFPNNGGYQYALAKQQGIQNDMSLFLTPSAVKESVLYNVKGENFTVVRNSTATYVDEDGIIRTAEIDVARIDYTSGDAVILLESQSANLMLRSEEFENANWAAGVNTIVTANQAISPNATLTADFMQTVGAGNSFLRQVTPSNLTSGVAYTLTVFMKSTNGDITSNDILRIGNNGGSNDIFSLNETITSVYKRFELNFMPNFTQSYFVFVGLDLPNGSDINVWGAQLEESGVASSYIPTVASTVTRLADVVTLDTSLIVPALTSITETIDGVEQTPITTIPATYTIPFGNINKIIGLSN